MLNISSQIARDMVGVYMCNAGLRWDAIGKRIFLRSPEFCGMTVISRLTTWRISRTEPPEMSEMFPLTHSLVILFMRHTL